MQLKMEFKRICLLISSNFLMEFQLLFTLLSGSLLFLCMIKKYLHNSKCRQSKPKLPPGPRKFPIIGNLLQLRGALPHHSLRDLAKNYGPIMHLQLGEISAVIISSAEAAREVMKTHDTVFSNRPQLLASKILFYNCTGIISANYGDYWRMLRKICLSELLSAKRVQSFGLIREEEVGQLILSVSSSCESTINMTEKFFSMTNTIVSRAAFGHKCTHQEDFIHMMKEISTLASGFMFPDIFPSLKFLHPISNAKSALEKIHRRLDSILENIINEHRADRGTGKVAEEDLVDVLLKLQESSDLEVPITTENIKAIILDIFLAGTETSSTTLDWAMAEILRNSKVMHQAQAEVRQVCQGENKFQERNIEKLQYLKLIIKETLRLHPPGPLLLPRESREKCEINGYEIPIKTKVIVNAWAIGRDQDHWTNPESFAPERFYRSSRDFRGADFELIPFGAGRRACPGISFGIANIELPLAQLLYQFNWKLADGVKPEELDMSEGFGTAVRRQNELNLIATPYIP